MKRFLLATIACCVFAAVTPSRATDFSTDNSDLWGAPGEGGWGMQMVQRHDVIFATLFVYNNASAPVWYSATMTSSDKTNWTGGLWQTSGPWLGAAPYNEALVTYAPVGTIRFTASSDQNGLLSYTVNGATVNKAIMRLWIRNDDYSGDYVGVLAYNATNCPNPADNGPYENEIDISLIQHENPSGLFVVTRQQGDFPACVSSGDYTQYGQFARSQQVMTTCSDGSSVGNVTNYYQMNVTPTGVTMNFSAPGSNAGAKGCTLSGAMYGIRK